nr:component of a tRNA splicing complex, sen1 [Cryptomonas curvata]
MKKSIDSRLINEILSWQLSESDETKIHYKSKKIPRVFESIKEYKQKFEPLLLEEAREQIKHLFNKEKGPDKIENGEIHGKYIKNNKLFLIFNLLFGDIHRFQVGALVIVHLTIISLIKRKEKNLIFGIISEMQKEDRIIMIEIGLNNQYILLNVKQKVSIYLFSEISNIYSYIKEYDVIHSLEKIPVKIRNVILSGSHYKKTLLPINQGILHKYHLKRHFNSSQTSAILAVLEKEISLIQGPPGTGKTRTILGIISLIIKDSKNSYGSEKTFKSQMIEKTINSLKLKRLIVCATANAAVDENAMRCSMGFMFHKTKKIINPYSIIRMGPNYHFSIDHISLDSLALIWASENDENVKFWTNDKIMQKSRSYILKKGTVIYTTLACAGYSIFDQTKSFEVVIIDEAAQAIEIDTLIPLRSTCKKLVMIGDVQQLPATIFSKSSIVFEYDRSLFKRLQLQKYSVGFLETQYRMHPQISSFPARKFYKNGLRDSENVACIKKIHALRCFGPLLYFDVREGIEKNHMDQNTSWCNLDEIRVITLLLKSLICLYPGLNIRSVGIISGYNGQIKEIQICDINRKLDLKQQINTVDGFQGKEKDFIIFSCVRSKFERGIGFLSDCRRINVAFTRAKAGFWIVGNSSTLYKDVNWKEIIIDTQRRSRFFSFKKPFERASRRLIYWSPKDEEDYSFDGEDNLSVSFKLLSYLKKVLKQVF